MDSKTVDMINYLSTNINFECIFFFDEKEFKESSVILSFMDGVYNSIHRKVFLLTTNKLDVNNTLIGRPSRIRYRKSFDSLSELQYVKVGDHFSDCTILMTCPEKK